LRFKGNNASMKRTADGTFGFTNARTAALWAMREALDPGQEGGSPIALPPDQELLGDLTAPTFKYVPRGIEAEKAEDVKKKLGRSPDKGVAVIMSWWAGEKFLYKQPGGIEAAQARKTGRPSQTKAKMGHMNQRRR
jgi:hypothetical protein